MSDLAPDSLPSARATGTNWVTDLAFEVALGYYTSADLCVQYDVTEAQFERLREMTSFQRAVKAYRREIDDEGIAFRLRARKLAEAVLEELSGIAFDERLEPKDRLQAMTMLCRYAGFETKEQKTDTGVRLIINTNLSLGEGAAGPQGYTIEVPASNERDQQSLADKRSVTDIP